MLINSSELQSILINEFARRFKEEYTCKQVDCDREREHKIGGSPRKKNNGGGHNNNNFNNTFNNSSHAILTHGNLNSGLKNNSFTSELILKLISKHYY